MTKAMRAYASLADALGDNASPDSGDISAKFRVDAFAGSKTSGQLVFTSRDELHKLDGWWGGNTPNGSSPSFDYHLARFAAALL